VLDGSAEEYRAENGNTCAPGNGMCRGAQLQETQQDEDEQRRELRTKVEKGQESKQQRGKRYSEKLKAAENTAPGTVELAIQRSGS
jgi:protein subunit release factor B